MSPNRAHMSVLTLALLNVAAVLSIVNYPAQAEYGCAIVFYVTASALFFFAPTALVSAEIASAWPQEGGLYLWGKEAFGPNYGFAMVVLQWMNSLPWYATVLTFIATTFAYMFAPGLASNRLYVWLMVAGTMWLCTVLNLKSVKFYCRLSSLGGLFGTVIPTGVIILLAAAFLLRGNHPVIPVGASAFLPNLDSLTQWMLLAGMMVSLAGIDMPAVHVLDVDNPERNFPKAILISSVLIVLGSILGSLSISLIVSPAQLSMASGAGEAFSRICETLGISWFNPVMCAFLILGGLTTVITWVLGPSRALLKVAQEGHLPKWFAQSTPDGIPTHILFLQAAITSVLALVIFFMPTISGAFWVMMALSAQMYMSMYVMMFLAAYRLRKKFPEKKRPFAVPGGLAGMGIVCGVGIATSLLALASGWIPPSNVRAEGDGASALYTALLILAPLAMIGITLLISRLEARRRRETVPQRVPPQIRPS